VALLHDRDSRHELCREQADCIKGPVITTWAVITEAAWLLQDLPNGLNSLLHALDDQDIQCLHLEPSAVAWLANCAQQYKNLNPQLADLSLLYLAERLGIQHVFTLDRRDFSVYRTVAGTPFHLLPESL
jgi:predicted nucleic acid-binding protein